MMADATPANILARYDARMVGQLCNDENGQLSPEDVVTSTRLLAALDDATGMVRSAATASRQYTTEQMDELSTAEDAYLIRLVCDLAIGLLYQTRGAGIPDGHAARITAAERMLDDLRRGRRIFALRSAENASLLTPRRIDGTTAERLYPASASPLFPDITRRYS